MFCVLSVVKIFAQVNINHTHAHTNLPPSDARQLAGKCLVILIKPYCCHTYKTSDIVLKPHISVRSCNCKKHSTTCRTACWAAIEGLWKRRQALANLERERQDATKGGGPEFLPNNRQASVGPSCNTLEPARIESEGKLWQEARSKKSGSQKSSVEIVDISPLGAEWKSTKLWNSWRLSPL